MENLSVKNINFVIAKLYPGCAPIDPEFVPRINELSNPIREYIISGNKDVDSLIKRMRDLANEKDTKREKYIDDLYIFAMKFQHTSMQRRHDLMDICIKDYERERGIFYHEELKYHLSKIITTLSDIKDLTYDQLIIFIFREIFSLFVMMLGGEKVKLITSKHLDKIKHMNFVL